MLQPINEILKTHIKLFNQNLSNLAQVKLFRENLYIPWLIIILMIFKNIILLGNFLNINSDDILKCYTWVIFFK